MENERAMVTAVYRLNLHCNECARAVKKPIMRTQGVEKVDIDMESGKVTVKGIFDANKVYEVMVKNSKRKVEWVSPRPIQKQENAEMIQKKEEVVKTTVIKLHLHCEKCKNDLEKMMLKHEGVYSVRMNREEQTCTVVGIAEENNLLKYIHQKTGKRGKVIEQKTEQRDEVREVFREEEWWRRREVLVPCFLHCGHAPQWFSDENPNACSLM